MRTARPTVRQLLYDYGGAVASPPRFRPRTRRRGGEVARALGVLAQRLVHDLVAAASDRDSSSSATQHSGASPTTSNASASSRTSIWKSRVRYLMADCDALPPTSRASGALTRLLQSRRSATARARLRSGLAVCRWPPGDHVVDVTAALDLGSGGAEGRLAARSRATDPTSDSHIGRWQLRQLIDRALEHRPEVNRLWRRRPSRPDDAIAL